MRPLSSKAHDDPYAPPTPEVEISLERVRSAIPRVPPLLSWRVGFWVALGELTLLIAIFSIELSAGELLALPLATPSVERMFPDNIPDVVLRYRPIWFPIAAAGTFTLCALTLFRLSRHEPSRTLTSSTLGFAAATGIVAPVAKLFEGRYSFDLPLGPSAADTAVMACFEEFCFNLAILLFSLIVGGFVRVVGSSLKFELGLHEIPSALPSSNES